jgi:uncharacterized protein (TIGR00369 family)
MSANAPAPQGGPAEELWLERMSAIVRGMMDATPYARAIGLEVSGFAPSKASARVAYREDLIGDPATGVIAGGVVTALLDHTCGMSVMAALAAPTTIATLDLRIDYMRAAKPGAAIIAEAHCYKVAHAVAFVRAIAHDGAPDDPIANATAAFMLNSSEGRRPGANRKAPA